MNFPEQYRWKNAPEPWASSYGDKGGVFSIPCGSDVLLCIASEGEGWDHVSVTVRNRRGVPLSRCPTWEQMCQVKGVFWTEAEAVMQLHPRASEYVNAHKFCLHLWRPHDVAIPEPPSIMVGPKEDAV